MDALLPHRDLAPKDRNGASDPFVRVRYNGRTQETSVRGLGVAGGPLSPGRGRLGLRSHRRGLEKWVTSVHSRSQPFWHQPLQPQLPLTPSHMGQDSQCGVHLHGPTAPHTAFLTSRKQRGWWAQP